MYIPESNPEDEVNDCYKTTEFMGYESENSDTSNPMEQID